MTRMTTTTQLDEVREYVTAVRDAWLEVNDSSGWHGNFPLVTAMRMVREYGYADDVLVDIEIERVMSEAIRVDLPGLVLWQARTNAPLSMVLDMWQLTPAGTALRDRADVLAYFERALKAIGKNAA